MAAMAVSVVAKAVPTITWVSGWTRLASARISRPPTPGMRRSVITTSNSRVARAATPSCPPAAASTRCPARRRKMARNSRIERSSSTIRMLPVRAAMRVATGLYPTGPPARSAGGNRQLEGHHQRVAADAVLHPGQLPEAEPGIEAGRRVLLAHRQHEAREVGAGRLDEGLHEETT